MIEYWYIFLIGTYLISMIPIVGKYFSLINTLFHELGHAIFSILTNGHVYKISLFSNTDGVAITGSSTKFSKIVTSFAGYPFASFIAFISFYILSLDKYSYFYLMGIAIVVLLTCILWVRNGYGWFWCITLISIITIAYYYGTDYHINLISYIVAFILLTQSIWTSFVILKISITNPKNAGDTSVLSNSTFISARIWGLIFLLQSLVFASFTFKLFII